MKPRSAGRLLPPAFCLLPSASCLLLSAFCPQLSAEIIDRIVITVGNQVITESQIDDEIRVTAFLNREKLDLNIDAKRPAASRLIEQAFIKREMDQSRYPLPEVTDASASLESLKT